MEIPKKVLKLLNEQFYNELYAAHLYFAMSASLKRSPFQGCAKWMAVQYKEEMEHAGKFYEYITSRDAPFTADAVRKPEKDSFKSPLEAFKLAYAHEQIVTAQITKIYELATEEKDYVTVDFLSWFLKEQVEEEHSARAFVRGLELAGDNLTLVFGVDHWAAKRGEE